MADRRTLNIPCEFRDLKKSVQVRYRACPNFSTKNLVLYAEESKSKYPLDRNYEFTIVSKIPVELTKGFNLIAFYVYIKAEIQDEKFSRGCSTWIESDRMKNNNGYLSGASNTGFVKLTGSDICSKYRPSNDYTHGLYMFFSEPDKNNFLKAFNGNCDFPNKPNILRIREKNIYENKLSLDVPMHNLKEIDSDCYKYQSSQRLSGWNENTLKNRFTWVHSNIEPIIVIEYEIAAPEAPSSLSPSNAEINPKKNIEFKWTAKEEQTAFEFQWALNSEVWGEIISRDTPVPKYIMPAGTIINTTGYIQWRVRYKDERGEWSEWTKATATLGVPPQPAPIPFYPVDDRIFTNNFCSFEWQFAASSSIDEQKAFELMYHFGDYQWKKIEGMTKQSSVQIYIPTDISRTVGQWKVRITNNFGEVSEWSEAVRFTILSAPTKPRIISVNETNRPIVQWVVADQAVYRLHVISQNNQLLYDSGWIVNEATRNHKIGTPLQNGRNIFYLQIIDKYGLKSELESYAVTINVTGDKPSINGELIPYGVKIFGDGLVERDGCIIGETENGSFSDYTCGKKVEYTYRIITKGDNAFFSEPLKITVEFSGATIAPLSNASRMVYLEYNLGVKPDVQKAIHMDKSAVQIDGKKYPIAFFGKNITETISLKYFLFSKESVFENLGVKKEGRQYKDLLALVQRHEPIIYRDVYGNVEVGIIKALNRTKHPMGYSVSFAIEVVDHEISL